MDEAPAGMLSIADPDGREVRAFRAMARQVLSSSVLPLLGEAERTRRFPREAVAAFGRAGLFRQRWHAGEHGDMGRAMLLWEETGRSLASGIGTGLGVHGELSISLLRRYAHTPLAQDVLNGALAGDLVCCTAITEEMAGSDFTALRTELRPDGTSWRVHGDKWFVAAGDAADYILVLAKHDGELAIVIVPREQAVLIKRLPTVGQRSLGTARLAIDARVPDEALLAPPGQGLAAIRWGVFHERLGMTAAMVGGMDAALALAIGRLKERRQFGQTLYRNEALRLRLAELSIQATMVRRTLHSIAACLCVGAHVASAEVGAVKAISARLTEQVMSECLQLVGGRGYLEDETPLAMMWRDARVARFGAGADDPLLAGYAATLREDRELYRAWSDSPILRTAVGEQAHA